jgi:hypothetical protein
VGEDEGPASAGVMMVGVGSAMALPLQSACGTRLSCFPVAEVRTRDANRVLRYLIVDKVVVADLARDLALTTTTPSTMARLDPLLSLFPTVKTPATCLSGKPGRRQDPSGPAERHKIGAHKRPPYGCL